ncbi:MAG: hypothetical protein H7336_16390 [Bacteriovorax sp.]|nr:hypothetical protein [Bacteriovorax sp.]
MKIKNVLLLVSITAVSSCSTYWPSYWRKPTSINEKTSELLEKSQSILDRVTARDLTPESCSADLDSLIVYYSQAPASINIDAVKNQGQEILDQSFEARMALHSQLSSLPVECKAKVKTLFVKMRMTEDYVGVHFYNDQQISAESIKYQEEPVPVFEADKYHPYHVGAGIDPKVKFEFRNGDIMITKGVSFISSTISELATPKSLFSHIVFVHVDSSTKVVTTIESYVGRGVSIFPIDEALKNENARILILRAKDADLASRAADYMYNKVVKLKSEGKVILYDYNLDFSDNSHLSCEEVAYDSFKTVSKGAVILPEMESQIELNDQKFLNRVGVKKGSMMVPTDMETDSRFDVVLDWTDYRVMRDSWRKDALLGEMFRWISDYKYRIHENMTTVAAKVIWSTRHIPGLWGMLSKVSGIPKDFTKDVPSLTITTIASLKAIGNELLPVVTSADQEFYASTGKWMTKEELSKTLDEYRKTNPKKLRKVFRP